MVQNKKPKKNTAPKSTNEAQNAKNNPNDTQNTPDLSGPTFNSSIDTQTGSSHTTISGISAKPEDTQTTKQQLPQKTWRKCTERFCSYKTWVEDTKNCPIHPKIVLVKIKK